MLRTLTDGSGKNVIVSPLSVWLALAMTYNGAVGDTRTAIAKTLGAASLTDEAFNRNNRSLLDEHIDRSDALGVIAQEGLPVLRRCSSSSHHVLGDGRLADLDTELEHLTVDPGRSPERVGAAHPPNQIANFALY